MTWELLLLLLGWWVSGIFGAWLSHCALEYKRICPAPYNIAWYMFFGVLGLGLYLTASLWCLLSWLEVWHDRFKASRKYVWWKKPICDWFKKPPAPKPEPEVWCRLEPNDYDDWGGKITVWGGGGSGVVDDVKKGS